MVTERTASSGEPLVGSVFYEQARGILIGAFGCTADEAARLIGEASARADVSPKQVVTNIVSPETRRAELAAIAESR